MLVLGGTAFLSRAVAAAARDFGHEVVCLARGVSGSVPDGTRLVRADRDRPDAYRRLDGSFDAVVDVSNVPAQVRSALAALAGRAGHWTYVSTCNVYADDATPGQGADAELVAATDDSDPDSYGGRNVAAERAVVEAMGADRAFRCRPGLIVGPGDTTVRFRYWPQRLAAGGEVLAPGDPRRPVQVVDVRDLADWIVRAGAGGLAGDYTAVGVPVPMARLLSQVAAGVGVEEPRLTWIDQEFLIRHGVHPWAGPRSLPLWLPLPEYAGFCDRDVSASLAAGLRTRALSETARDTLAAEATAGRPRPEHVGGLTPDQEAELLEAWHAGHAE